MSGVRIDIEQRRKTGKKRIDENDATFSVDLDVVDVDIARDSGLSRRIEQIVSLIVARTCNRYKAPDLKEGRKIKIAASRAKRHRPLNRPLKDGDRPFCVDADEKEFLAW